MLKNLQPAPNSADDIGGLDDYTDEDDPLTKEEKAAKIKEM